MEGEIDFSSYRPMNIGSFTNDRSKRNPLEQFKIIFLSTVKTIDAELRDTVISPFFETVKKFPFLLKYNPRTLAAAYVLSISEPSDISKNLTDLATILINYSKSRAPIPKVSKKKSSRKKSSSPSRSDNSPTQSAQSSKKSGRSSNNLDEITRFKTDILRYYRVLTETDLSSLPAVNYLYSPESDDIDADDVSNTSYFNDLNDLDYRQDSQFSLEYDDVDE